VGWGGPTFLCKGPQPQLWAVSLVAHVPIIAVYLTVWTVLQSFTVCMIY
jgi:hypothetical protein